MTSYEKARLAYDVIHPAGQNGSLLSPIIMLHGMASSRKTWHLLTEELANKTGRKVYIVDARNHGDSEWKDEFDYQVMAKDLIHFMDQLGIASAIIVGHSMGGKTAMVLATKEPEKVDRLVIEDISNRTLEANAKRFPYEYLKLLRKCLTIIPPDTDLESAKKMAHQFLSSNTPPEHRSPPDRNQISSTLPLRKTADGFSWKANLDVLEKNFYCGPKPENIIEGFYGGETLFIYGTKSAYNVPNDKDLILKMFPKSCFKAIEGATHLVHTEYPKEFLQALLEFVK